MLAGVSALSLAGCRSDMQNQPYYRPLRESNFFADKRSARPIIEGTRGARPSWMPDTYFYTGKIGANDGDYMPFPVTAEVLARGQQRYNIYCSPCHSELGDGNGMIVQRGYKRPPSYHVERLRKAPIGYFFDVMTNGYGAMPDYAVQVEPKDRWAIAAYIRALQLSQGRHQGGCSGGPSRSPINRASRGMQIVAPYDTQSLYPGRLRGERHGSCQRRPAATMSRESLQVQTEYPVPAAAAGWQSRALIIGVVGAALCVVGAFLSLDSFLRGYLIAYMFWTGLSLGCLALLMVQYLSGGLWALVIRRVLEAGAKGLPLMAVLFLPILFVAAPPVRVDGAPGREGAVVSQHAWLDLPVRVVFRLLDSFDEEAY